jgi:hypothetical protein
VSEEKKGNAKAERKKQSESLFYLDHVNNKRKNTIEILELIAYGKDSFKREMPQFCKECEI